jgi:hypothetical protein
MIYGSGIHNFDSFRTGYYRYLNADGKCVDLICSDIKSELHKI